MKLKYSVTFLTPLSVSFIGNLYGKYNFCVFPRRNNILLYNSILKGKLISPPDSASSPL